MSVKQAKVVINFPTWNSLSSSVKSVLGFFMKHASCFFKGKYSDIDNTLESFSGNIRLNSHSLMTTGNTLSLVDSGLELNIAYTDDTFPITSSDYLPNCNTTLVEKDAKIRLCKVSSDNVEVASENIGPFDNIPVKMYTLVNDNKNTSVFTIPNDMDIAVGNIIQTDIDTTSKNLNIDFQIRTSSFHITDGNNVNRDVYYKIGVCPLEKSISYDNYSVGLPSSNDLTVEDLKDLVVNDGILINKEASTYFYKIGNLSFKAENFLSDEFGFKKFFISPILQNNGNIVGLAYAELFEENGEAITDEIEPDVTLCCRSSENAEPDQISMNSETGLGLLVTSNNIEGGFIESDYTPLEVGIYVDNVLTNVNRDLTYYDLGYSEYYTADHYDSRNGAAPRVIGSSLPHENDRIYSSCIDEYVPTLIYVNDVESLVDGDKTYHELGYDGYYSASEYSSDSENIPLLDASLYPQSGYHIYDNCIDRAVTIIVDSTNVKVDSRKTYGQLNYSNYYTSSSYNSFDGPVPIVNASANPQEGDHIYSSIENTANVVNVFVDTESVSVNGDVSWLENGYSSSNYYTVSTYNSYEWPDTSLLRIDDTVCPEEGDHIYSSIQDTANVITIYVNNAQTSVNGDLTYSENGYDNYYTEETYDSSVDNVPLLDSSNYPQEGDHIYSTCTDLYDPMVTIYVDGSSVSVDERMTYGELGYSDYYTEEYYNSTYEDEPLVDADANPQEGDYIYSSCIDTGGSGGGDVDC